MATPGVSRTICATKEKENDLSFTYIPEARKMPLGEILFGVILKCAFFNRNAFDKRQICLVVRYTVHCLMPVGYVTLSKGSSG